VAKDAHHGDDVAGIWISGRPNRAVPTPNAAWQTELTRDLGFGQWFSGVEGDNRRERQGNHAR
jgi:hypothetical protein